MVPHMVPISWRQIKNGIRLDLAQHPSDQQIFVVSNRIPAHPGGARRHEPADRQPMRPGQAGARSPAQHMRPLPHREVAAAVAAVRASGEPPVVTLAFEFLVLTAARSGEVRFATWDEIDATDHVWTIQATKMKMKRDHRVPLCGLALEVLDAARTLGDAGPLVFTTGGGRPLSAKRLRRLLERCGIACVPHGFRSSFRDWAAEETNHPREVIEAALAHIVQNRVEAAYARSDLFERRRRLMHDWAAYLVDAHRRQPPIAEPAEQGIAGRAAP